MCTDANHARLLQRAPEPLARPLREFGVNVAERVPGGFLELHGMGNRVAQEQATPFA